MHNPLPPAQNLDTNVKIYKGYNAWGKKYNLTKNTTNTKRYTMFSTTTIALVSEFHAAHVGLDVVTTDEAMLHDAVHAYLGLGVSLEEEEVVLNCVNTLAGLGCSAHLSDRVELLISLLEVDVLVELSAAACVFFNN